MGISLQRMSRSNPPKLAVIMPMTTAMNPLAPAESAACAPMSAKTDSPMASAQSSSRLQRTGRAGRGAKRPQTNTAQAASRVMTRYSHCVIQ